MDNLHDEHVFSILISTWNNFEALRITIESLRKNSAYKHQIIVHINEGCDNTLAWVEANEIEYTYTRLNVGICYSANVCSSLAKCEYVLMSGDSNYFCPGWDIFLVSMANKQKNDFWCISGTSINSPTTENAVTAIDFFGDSAATFNEELLLASFSQLSFSNWVGVNMHVLLLKRIMWAAVGGLSIEFNPGRFSDTDLAMKLWTLGMREFIGVANSCIYHIGQKKEMKIRENNGKRTFLKKWDISPDTFLRYYIRGDNAGHVPLVIVVKDFLLGLLSPAR